MNLWLTNTLTQQKELFSPLESHEIKLYLCGPTVYDQPHIGNARPVVVFDVLHRLLKHLYEPHDYKVTFVHNITDIDDKIITAAKEQNISITELTQKTEHLYTDELAQLDILPHTHTPRATEHIAQMLELIKSLLDNGHAYAEDNHVLFDVQSFKEYGQLSKRNLNDMLSGARVEVASYKRYSGDFVLWKPAKDDEPGWPSPYGYGRPGWHLECSAMSHQYLGKTFDIHAGGQELIFPHHENEIAQSVCGYDTSCVARFWLHNGPLTMMGEKMSKSLGNIVLLKDLLAQYPGEVMRLVLLSAHYRQPLDFQQNKCELAKTTLDRFYLVLREFPNIAESAEDVAIDERIVDALSDDLNTPMAISILHELLNDVNRTSLGQGREFAAAKLKASANLLGLLQNDPNVWLQGSGGKLQIEEIEKLLQKREEARDKRDYVQADAIRKDLLENGIVLEDKADKTIWRRL